jgi:uncharacterized membrane protein
MASQTEPHDMLVIAYPTESQAQLALDSLQQLSHEHVVQLKNAAVIVRERSGKIAIHETREFNAKQGAITGALAGVLVSRLTNGHLLGEAALGAVGGVVASKVIDPGFNDVELRQIADGLTPGSSALVAIVHVNHVEKAVQTLREYPGGRIIRQTLSPDVERQLEQAIQG